MKTGLRRLKRINLILSQTAAIFSSLMPGALRLIWRKWNQMDMTFYNNIFFSLFLSQTHTLYSLKHTYTLISHTLNRHKHTHTLSLSSFSFFLFTHTLCVSLSLCFLPHMHTLCRAATQSNGSFHLNTFYNIPSSNKVKIELQTN